MIGAVGLMHTVGCCLLMRCLAGYLQSDQVNRRPAGGNIGQQALLVIALGQCLTRRVGSCRVPAV